MPENQVHVLIDELVFGKKFRKVHHAMDWPSRIYGPKHRQIAFHDPKSAYLMGYLVAGPKGGLAALIHLQVDRSMKSDSPLAYALEIMSRKRKRY